MWATLSFTAPGVNPGGTIGHAEGTRTPKPLRGHLERVSTLAICILRGDECLIFARLALPDTLGGGIWVQTKPRMSYCFHLFPPCGP